MLARSHRLSGAIVYVHKYEVYVLQQYNKVSWTASYFKQKIYHKQW